MGFVIPIRRVKNSERGQALIQIMIAGSIMSIIMAGMLTMMSLQNKENKALGEKLTALDLSRTITATLADPNACNELLNASNIVNGIHALTFDASHVSHDKPHVINLHQIPRFVPSNPSIIRAKNGIQLNITSQNTGDLIINFDQTNLVHPIKNLSFPVSLFSSGPINNTMINGCANASTLSPGLLVGWCSHNWGGHQTDLTTISPPMTWGGYGVGCSCPSGYLKVVLGTCNFGSCLTASWNSDGTELYFYSCKKL